MACLCRLRSNKCIIAKISITDCKVLCRMTASLNNIIIQKSMAVIARDIVPIWLDNARWCCQPPSRFRTAGISWGPGAWRRPDLPQHPFGGDAHQHCFLTSFKTDCPSSFAVESLLGTAKQ